MTTVTRAQTELTNVRARIVGERDGFLADAIVWVVRMSATAGRAVATVARRVGAVVTALGWSLLALTVLAPGRVIPGSTVRQSTGASVWLAARNRGSRRRRSVGGERVPGAIRAGGVEMLE